MSRLHLWVVALAATSFLAGGAAGLFTGRELQPEFHGEGRLDDYQQMFLTRFDLSPERSRLFSELMRNYNKEIEDLRQEALEISMSEMEPRLNRLGLRYRDMIRNHVLPADQRVEFDRLAASTDWPAPEDS